MPSSITFTVADRGNERATATIPVLPVTAANFDAVLGNIATQGRFELQTAIEGLIHGGEVARVSAKAYDIPTAEFVPNPNNANQRENGLRFYMRGNSSGKLYTLTIPTVLLSALTFLGTGDEVDLDDSSVVSEMVAALEDHYRGYTNPAAGTTEVITVEKAVFVASNT